MAGKKPSPKRSRRTAFVPRLLVRTALAGVVPACALVGATGAAAGCSSNSSGVPTDTGVFGVAAVAYPAYESGVPDGSGDGTSDVPSDGSDGGADTSPDVFGVAAVAYPAYETGAG